MRKLLLALLLAASPAFAALENTWVTSPNNTLDSTSVTTSSKNQLWMMAAALTGNTTVWANATGGATPAHPWTIVCTSNGATAPSDQCQADTTDRLHLSAASYTAGDWVRFNGTGAHSYVQLKSAAFGGYPAIYMLIDWSTASDQTVTISFALTKMLCAASPCTTSTAPTSADKWSHTSYAFNVNSIASQNRLMFSVDQYGSFWFQPSRDGGGFAGILPLVGVFIKDYKPADTIPFLSSIVTACATFSNATNNSWSTNNAGTGFQGRKPDNSAAALVVALVYAYGNNTLTCMFTTGTSSSICTGGTPLAGTDGVDSKWDDLPIYLYDTNANTLRGRLPDFRWAPGTLPGASTGPSTPPYTNMAEGCTISPGTQAWFPYVNSVVPVI